jgi:biofilm PGA synthesis N-glycosyltransferase PgaC
MTDGRRLLIVSPVFNEAAHLARTASAVAAQCRRPDRWIVVDDRSTDDTLAIARAWEARLPFMTVVQSPPRAEQQVDGLAIARDARAFNFGLELGSWRDFDLVGKLDGDVELPAKWFEELVRRFDSEPSLGLAGGRLIEPSQDGWQLIVIPDHHVHGAVKLYSRACLDAIGGIPERLAWDTIDETYARMRGFETWSYPDLVARHHRACASANGRLRGRARHGECAWILHYGASWTLLRSAKVAKAPPVGLSGLAFLYGYAAALARGVPRVEDREFRRFARRELRARLAAPLRMQRRGSPRIGRVEV